MDAWFDDFEEFLVAKNLANKPSQIWNCDETGFDMQGRAGNIIGPSDRKQAPYRVLSGSREHITMLPCFNACSQWMPPYFIFPGKCIPVTYNPLEGGVDGSVFSMTDSGYMDTQTFYMWFANHFLPNLPPARPVVLLIDCPANSHQVKKRDNRQETRRKSPYNRWPSDWKGASRALILFLGSLKLDRS